MANRKKPPAKKPKASSARKKNGQFAAGNSGRPKGAVGKVKAELAEASRAMYWENRDKVMREIFDDESGRVSILYLKLQALEHLAERGYGKPPKEVKLSTDTDTAESIIAAMAARRGIE